MTADPPTYANSASATSEAKCPNTYCYGGWVGRGDNESGGAPAFPCRHEKCPHREVAEVAALAGREGSDDA